MLAASWFLLAVLAQPLQHRVEVLGGGASAFWSGGADSWTPVHADVVLEARRSAEGAASATLTLDVLRAAERWTVELSQLRPGGMLIDADLAGPGGWVHAALALAGTARITRGGALVSDTAALRAVALTTGYHADDASFRTLPAGRSGDLELLIRLEGLPGGEVVEIGFEHPDIRLDGAALRPAPMADASAPAWPGARAGPGVGGSGPADTVLPGPVPALPARPGRSRPGLPMTSAPAGAVPLPSTPAPANAGPAAALPATPSPENARAGQSLPSTPSPVNAGPDAALPSTPAPANATDAPLLPSTPSPANAGRATPLVPSPVPLEAAPGPAAPGTPAPAGSPPGPAHGGTTPAGPTWFPAPLPPSPVPDEAPKRSKRTRFASSASKIDPSGQGSTVPLRVQLRARALDPSRNLPRIALADRG